MPDIAKLGIVPLELCPLGSSRVEAYPKGREEDVTAGTSHAVEHRGLGTVPSKLF